ncbi:MAG: hypothetical protein AAF149_24070 [Bacteroidota bacterium]
MEKLSVIAIAIEVRISLIFNRTPHPRAVNSFVNHKYRTVLEFEEHDRPRD